MPFYTANKSSVRENNKRNYVGYLIRDFDRTYLRLMCCFFLFSNYQKLECSEGCVCQNVWKKKRNKRRTNRKASERARAGTERKKERKRFFVGFCMTCLLRGDFLTNAIKLRSLNKKFSTYFIDCCVESKEINKSRNRY